VKDPIKQLYILETDKIEYDEDLTYDIYLTLTEESYKSMNLSNMISSKSVQQKLNDRIFELLENNKYEYVKIISTSVIVKQMFINITYSIEYTPEEEISTSLVDIFPEDVIRYELLPKMKPCELYSFSSTDRNMFKYINSIPYYKNKLKVTKAVYDFIKDGTLAYKILKMMTTRRTGINKIKNLKISGSNIIRIASIMKKNMIKENINLIPLLGQLYPEHKGKGTADDYLTAKVFSNILDHRYIMKEYSNIINEKSSIRSGQRLNSFKSKYFNKIKDNYAFTCEALYYSIMVAENLIYSSMLEIVYNYLLKNKDYSPFYVNDLELVENSIYNIIFKENKNKNKLTYVLSQEILNYIINTEKITKNDLYSIADKYKKYI
jgi:hypothetical protein